ncbi:prolyl oligopeptidase family serine peptidase [Neptuniibacter sp.]|uniref:S9 family peptidase n=1 Tax=Neptuniibacter sp. TaxID=1962643 RepID=UPI00261CBB87|nr:prolyl oligopeptidase family serine peptidase [Neptuniibacter sp.]MCP4595889.1 S9 family peptidase [Neptuniibacter sp.]
MTNTKPGFWRSNLSEEQAISASKDFSQLEYSANGGLYWVEQRPDQQGRSVLCRFAEGELYELIDSHYSVQSKVHEYGGRSWALLGEKLVFVNGSDQQLYIQSATVQEVPIQLTDIDSARFIEPVWDKKRDRLIAVQEVHTEQGVINRLVAVNLDSGSIDILHQKYDFYAYPAISDAGDGLAFIGWNHPEQPWTSTLLNLARLDERGAIVVCDIAAGGDGDEALSQPCFIADDLLWFISDRSGYWNIYKCSLAGSVIEHLDVDADVMPAPWQSGLNSYVVIDGECVWVEQRHSGARLRWGEHDITPQGFTYFRSLAASKSRVYCVAAGPSKLPQILSISKDGKEISEIIKITSPLAGAEISKPVAMTFGQEDKSYGYFYPATNSAYLEEQKAPLVVFLHGGPTACTYPAFNLKIQYWTQRGFAVLDLNYKGSSGYGREYRMQLQHHWGELEINDIKQSVESLVEADLVDPEALFIRGNSSGGYSALNALCDLNMFAGGASLYGVTDPAELGKVTHKFESCYLDWLIGDVESDQARYAQYSPVNKVEQIDCPVIFFQGDNDRVVVPEQTCVMIKKLKAKDQIVESVFFPDEAHGFRKAENQVRVLRQELEFYQKVIEG